MNYTINLHGDRRVQIPTGLPELISDIAREVLRNKPVNLILFIADYLNSKLAAREKAAHATDFVDTIFESVRLEILQYRKYGLKEEVAIEAAMRIQALFRGYKVRKGIKEANRKLESIRKTEEQNTEQKKLQVRRTSFEDEHSNASSRSSSFKFNYSFRYLKAADDESQGESEIYMPPSKLNIGEGYDALENELTAKISMVSQATPPVRTNVLMSLPKALSSEVRHKSTESNQHTNNEQQNIENNNEHITNSND